MRVSHSNRWPDKAFAEKRGHRVATDSAGEGCQQWTVSDLKIGVGVGVGGAQLVARGWLAQG